jgi:hypothetical protein
VIGEPTVIGRQYFVRQAATLLTFTQSTNNPRLAAVLIVKAADLKSQLDESTRPDPSPLAPDAESEISPLTPDVEPEI